MTALRLLLCSLLLLGFARSVHAKYDPDTVPNNKFGIHIVDPNDIADAATLVNSSGGDWGYVTLVIQEDDRDLGKWQGVFDRMRKLHLIPIVRLATHIDGDKWVKPYADAPLDWARFLNSLNWPTENRYVIIYNEPNHANEWGGSIDPEDYARTLVRYARTLTDTSEDFFILPAGLDVSAASDGRSLDASVFLTRMLRAEPRLFDVLDGWTSHSYPNPGFSGSPYASGRGTLRSYLWELSYLRSLGLNRTLPVFITETGWIHSQGVSDNFGLLGEKQVSANLQTAAREVWSDPDVIAITPFVLNYQGLPFDHFSWKKLGSSDYYEFFATYRDIAKIRGMPKQRHKYTLDHRLIPVSLVAGSTYELSALLKNEGQGIYSEHDGYRLTFGPAASFTSSVDPLPDMEPGQYGTVNLNLEIPDVSGEREYFLDIVRDTTTVPIEHGTVTVVPPPSLTVTVSLGWRPDSSTDQATVLVYDGLTLLHKFDGITFKGGKTTVPGLRNIVPGMKYRIVVLVPYYLPRQSVVVVRRDVTDVRMPRMIPADFDRDGALTPRDILFVFRSPPHLLSGLLFGK